MLFRFLYIVCVVREPVKTKIGCYENWILFFYYLRVFYFVLWCFVCFRATHFWEGDVQSLVTLEEALRFTVTFKSRLKVL